MTAFHVLVPARMASTRLPGKPLRAVVGRALVLRVLDAVAGAGAASVHVATDSEEIANAVEGDGAAVIRTATDHESGTSRLAEAAAALDLPDDAVVVNVQGDEPEMPGECIRQVAALLAEDRDAQMATLWAACESEAQWRDPNVVKLVCDDRDRALYFSRAPIPAVRDGGWPADLARRHLGLYAYRAGALAAWNALPASRLERLESLEQLRALEAGWRIAVAPAIRPVPPGIDTPADLEAAQRRFEERETAENNE